ncbi:DUF1465 family protein [Altererythrobacter sp. MF3-039]|uniref:DUF1465 family protein n=1 Tax=Altererythrobacter sp. MF3-039 TaxID=3252901 RepID=UPI00390CD8CC
MRWTSDISEPIIEALYSEALVMADEVRARFDLAPVEDGVVQSDSEKLAHSVEGLRTTTRMMQILAWLLNQRAYFSGDLSETQLRRHGKLPDDREADAEQVALLEVETQELIRQTEQMHSRIARLDDAWRSGFEVNIPTVRQLRGRLEEAVGSL